MLFSVIFTFSFYLFICSDFQISRSDGSHRSTHDYDDSSTVRCKHFSVSISALEYVSNLNIYFILLLLFELIS